MLKCKDITFGVMDSLGRSLHDAGFTVCSVTGATIKAMKAVTVSDGRPSVLVLLFDVFLSITCKFSVSVNLPANPSAGIPVDGTNGSGIITDLSDPDCIDKVVAWMVEACDEGMKDDGK